MNNIELKEKAESFIKEKKWDLYLIDLFLNTKHFSSWSQRDDFESYNFGLTDITFLDKEIELKHSKKIIKFLRAKFNDINFMIGGEHESMYTPDSSFSLQTVILFIDEKLVMYVRYDEPDIDYSSLSSQYEVWSVEEFHNHTSIQELLSKTYLTNKQKTIERNNKFNSERDKSYKDKFSFD